MLRIDVRMDYFFNVKDKDWYLESFDDVQNEVSRKVSSLLKDGYVSGEMHGLLNKKDIHGWCVIDLQAIGMVNGKKNAVIDSSIEDISGLVKKGYTEGQIEVYVNDSPDIVNWGLFLHDKTITNEVNTLQTPN